MGITFDGSSSGGAGFNYASEPTNAPLNHGVTGFSRDRVPSRLGLTGAGSEDTRH